MEPPLLKMGQPATISPACSRLVASRTVKPVNAVSTSPTVPSERRAMELPKGLPRSVTDAAIEPFHPQFHGGLLSLCVVVGIPALVGHNKLPHFILPSLMELDLESPAESGY